MPVRTNFSTKTRATAPLLREPAAEFGRIIWEIKRRTESMYQIAERNHSESINNVAGGIQTNITLLLLSQKGNGLTDMKRLLKKELSAKLSFC